MPDLPIIDDNNFENFVEAGVRGYEGMFEPGAQLSCGSFEDIGIPLIPESQWDDVIRQQQKDGATLRQMIEDMGLPPKNQQSVPYCWVFAPTHCCEIIRMMETGKVFSYSPASCGAPIKGFRRVGGWGSQALERMKVHGINDSEDWPDTAVSRRYFTEENKRNARAHVALEYVVLNSWQERASCILAGVPTADGYPWWRHEVIGTGLTIGDHDLEIRNSWGGWGENGFGLLRGRRKHAGDSVAITAMKPI